MHFGPWHPLAEASTAAPEAPGVAQMRAEDLLDYETGRSAMILYACSGETEPLRTWVAGRGAKEIQRAQAAGARWIRFADTPEPAREMNRLLATFAERFGAPPLANAGRVRRKDDE